MARISDAEIERLKRTVSIVELAEASGVRLERRGAQLAGRCIFHHPDKTPSLLITPAKQLFHCMGCNAGGSVVDFVMKRDNTSFVRAIETLRAFAASRESEPKKAPIPEAKAPSSSSRKPTRSTSKNVDVDEPHGDRTVDEYTTLDEAVAIYGDSFRRTARAQDYALSRGLDHPELAEQYRLGFSSSGLLAKTFPPRSTPAGAEKRRQLDQLGLLKQGYEHFAGSLIVPITDESGRVQSLYGRRISPPARGIEVHRNLPGPLRGVFNVKSMAMGDTVIVCEAVIDALTIISAEIPLPTIAALGVSAFGSEHLAAIERYKTKRVLIAYDADAPGDRAAAELAEKLKIRGIASYRVMLPKGMDINEYARKLKPAQKSLRLVLQKAEPMLGAAALPQSWSMSSVTPMPAGPSEIAAPSAPEPAAIVAVPAPVVVPPRAVESPTRTVEALSPPTQSIEKISAEAASSPPSPLTALPSSGTSPTKVASPAPAVPGPSLEDVAMTEDGAEIFLTIGDRTYRVVGMAKNTSLGSLKVTLSAMRGEQYFIDALDLCHGRPRTQYEHMSAAELGVSEEQMHRDMGKVLRQLEQVQRERIRELMEPKNQRPEITPEDEAAAMAFWKSPDLIKRIGADLDALGLVGEETNKILAYIAATSRKTDDPLAILVQSSSAAGKTHLMQTVTSCFPPEETIRLSAVTTQALYYMGETELCHKILAIAEEEGAERASYALKLLQSDHDLVIASTGKDAQTGELRTKPRTVRGPVMIFLTTTAVEMDEELANRCIVLTVDEGRAQTQAIHRMQRWGETLEGMMAKRGRKKITHLHQNAQRLLRPIAVANPSAHVLTFADGWTRTRRDHAKYLGLMRSVAFLRQFQKEVMRVEHEDGEVFEYIDIDREDVELANRLLSDVLSRTASDMPPQTERLLALIDRFVTARAQEKQVDRSEVRFTRREIREATGYSNSQLKTHLRRLEDLELLMLRGGRGYRFEYQLMTAPTVGGLKLASHSVVAETPKRSGSEPTWSGQKANMVWPKTADGLGMEGVARPSFSGTSNRENKDEVPTRSDSSETHERGPAKNGATNGVHAAPVKSARRPS